MSVALTYLSLSGVGVPPYSARGLKQSYAPIQQSSQLRRTVNGALVDLGLEEFQKFSSTISCTDQQPPACDGVWPGRQITVDCLFHLCYKTSGGTPSRTVVSGSSYTDGDYTFYRPQLTMMVVSYNVDEDEWGAEVGWSMQLEEV